MDKFPPKLEKLPAYDGPRPTMKSEAEIVSKVNEIIDTINILSDILRQCDNLSHWDGWVGPRR